MQLSGNPATDNPDQRIAEDFKLCSVDRNIDARARALSDVTVTLVSFIAILWGLAGRLPHRAYGGLDI